MPAVATQIALNLGLIDDLVADRSKEWSVKELSTRYNASPVILGESNCPVIEVTDHAAKHAY